MSSTTRLLVLGAVRIFQPVHGYDVRRELVSWHVEDWASLAPGSIYNALKSLTKDGLLEVVGTNQVGGRPERTTYRLTPRGDEEFIELLRAAWWTVRTPIDPLCAAVSLISFLPRAEIVAALEARGAHIQGITRAAEHAITAITGTDKPEHVREVIRLLNARVGSEIAWGRALVDRLRAGEYVLGDDPPWSPDLAASDTTSATKVGSPRRAKPTAAKPPAPKATAARSTAAKAPAARSTAAKATALKPTSSKSPASKPNAKSSASKPPTSESPARRVATPTRSAAKPVRSATKSLGR